MCPRWPPGSANRKMLPVLCSVLDVLPQHSSTARVLAHPAQGIAQGSQYWEYTLKAWWLCQANALSSETQWHQGKVEDVQWRQQ